MMLSGTPTVAETVVESSLGAGQLQQELEADQHLGTSSLPLSLPLETNSSSSDVAAAATPTPAPTQLCLRSRKPSLSDQDHAPSTHQRRRRRKRRKSKRDEQETDAEETPQPSSSWPRKHLACIINFMARTLVWSSLVMLTAAVIWYSYELTKHGTDPHLIAWFSAGAFVILGFPISMWGIISHLANYNQPHVQCYIVRILWMVPIYSTESWLCLRFHRHAIYIETLRDCYESYVLYSFLQFLIQVLGGEEALVLLLKDKSPTRGFHMWGLQYTGLKPWLMGQPVRVTYEHGSSLKRVHWISPFFVKCKFGVLQYVLLKFVCSLVVMILELNGVYKEGDFTYKGGYLYICILTNLSQCWALYCLVFFYLATKNELSPIRPVPKFLSVKALVFFTWWQSVCISILYGMDLIPHYHSSTAFGAMMSAGSSSGIGSDGGTRDYDMPMSAEDALSLDQLGGVSEIAALAAASSNDFSASPSSSSELSSEWSSEDVAKGIQAYLICIEMFVAAIVHTVVFPHSEYTPQAVQARAQALNQTPHRDWNKRLGRRWKEWDNKSNYTSSSSTNKQVEMQPLSGRRRRLDSADATSTSAANDDPWVLYPSEHRRKPPPPSSLMAEDPMEMQFPENVARVERQPLLDPIESVSSTDLERPPEQGEDLTERSNEDDDDHGEFGDDEEEDENDDDEDYSSSSSGNDAKAVKVPSKPNFVSALLDSTIPQDLRDNTVGIIKGDYVVEKRTLLHHATTSDSYDLFSRNARVKKGMAVAAAAAAAAKAAQSSAKPS